MFVCSAYKLNKKSWDFCAGVNLFKLVTWQKAREKAHFQMRYLSFSLDNTVVSPKGIARLEKHTYKGN